MKQVVLKQLSPCEYDPQRSLVWRSGSLLEPGEKFRIPQDVTTSWLGFVARLEGDSFAYGLTRLDRTRPGGLVIRLTPAFLGIEPDSTMLEWRARLAVIGGDFTATLALGSQILSTYPPIEAVALTTPDDLHIGLGADDLPRCGLLNDCDEVVRSAGLAKNANSLTSLIFAGNLARLQAARASLLTTDRPVSNLIDVYA